MPKNQLPKNQLPTHQPRLDGPRMAKSGRNYTTVRLQSFRAPARRSLYSSNESRVDGKKRKGKRMDFACPINPENSRLLLLALKAVSIYSGAAPCIVPQCLLFILPPFPFGSHPPAACLPAMRAFSLPPLPACSPVYSPLPPFPCRPARCHLIRTPVSAHARPSSCAPI